MPIFKPARRFFRDSALAHQLLDGLKGVEIGGSSHNCFGLDTINVDIYPGMDTVYKKAEIDLCGEAMPVDVVAPGDALPFPDKSFDFVISSHVIEHFFDPIKALKEWARVARKYIYIIVPQPDAEPSDRGKLITPLDTLLARHSGEIPEKKTDEHHTRWTCETFIQMCAALGFHVSHWQNPDDKVGNGFTVVIDLQPQIITNIETKPKRKK
jgi:SAM-dependent methyltransferase